MLSPKIRKEIEDSFAHYPDKKAVCLEALKAVQRDKGWVDDESIKELAAVLGMSAEDLDAVATFYSLIFRKPVGAHVILLCNTVSCWVMGYQMILAHLKERLGIGLGETTSNGLFTLLPVPCLGACDQAPAMVVDEDLHVNLTPERVDDVLKLYGWEGA